MNIIGFAKLMQMIYGKRLPDLQKIQKMGLLAVKIAQHFALRVDFLDEKVCRHLSKLYRATMPSEAESLQKLLENRVDSRWFDNFTNIEETPFACASVGQVHRATLKNGDTVVVKIIKEDFKRGFLRDLRSLRRALSFALFCIPKLKKVFNPLAILDHIESYTLQELDLRNEIKGKEQLQKIKEKYRQRYDLERLQFPEFYEELSNETVLVAKFIQGKTYDEHLEDKTLSYEDLLQLFSLHGTFLFGAGLFHGDLHPGNVILGENGEVTFIDTGSVSVTSDIIKQSLLTFFVALSNEDLSGAAEDLRRMSFVEITELQFQRFQKQFYHLYDGFFGASVAEVSLTKKMMDTIKLGIEQGMTFDEKMFAIIKSLMYLDGMVLRCNPDAVLMSDMKPYIKKLCEVLEDAE